MGEWRLRHIQGGLVTRWMRPVGDSGGCVDRLVGWMTGWRRVGCTWLRRGGGEKIDPSVFVTQLYEGL